MENIMRIQVDEILTLSIKDRLRLVGEIWDSIAASPEEIPLTAAQRKDRETPDWCRSEMPLGRIPLARSPSLLPACRSSLASLKRLRLPVLWREGKELHWLALVHSSADSGKHALASIRKIPSKNCALKRRAYLHFVPDKN